MPKLLRTKKVYFYVALLFPLVLSSEAFLFLKTFGFRGLPQLFNRNILFATKLDEKQHLTVILPAYNESRRIGDTLRLYHEFLKTQLQQCNSDILVVDDGSTDGTARVVQDFAPANPVNVPVNCISLPCNQGKGAAVAFGIDHVARNQVKDSNNCLVLVADADASADIQSLPGVFDKLQDISQGGNVPAIVVGRRTYAESLSPSRMVLRWGFRTAVQILCGDMGVSDTQCGFKLMTLTAAQRLYSNLHLRGWSHDVEVLYRAKELGIPVAEQAVQWQDKEGSKLVTSPGGTIGASLTMLVEIAQLKFFYSVGIWKVSEK